MNTTENKEQLEAELFRTGTAIEAHRNLIKPLPSIRQWCKQWPGLGSTKMWSKILKGDFTQMKVEAQLPNYRGVLAALQTQVVERGSDDLYTDLAPAQAVMLAALRLMHHHGKDRLILVQGGSGSSKTSCLQLLSQNEAAGSMVMLEASDVTWRSPRAAIRDMLRGLGVGEETIPAATADMVDELLKVLKRRGRVIIAIDEAHHLNGSMLNLLKMLINKTEALFILAGMKTLFQKLRSVASEEAKQLIHNRLFAKITLTGPDVEGAEMFLTRRLAEVAVGRETTTLPSWKKATIKAIVSKSLNAGHWAYLRRVVDQVLDFGLSVEEIDDASLLAGAENALIEIS